MNVSANALEIIKEFEGLVLDAYLDPVNIPTIGYGTTRYPNGRKVRMGDSISESEAEAFLQFECEEIAKDISGATNGLIFNQNQFDALVSFCYNLGFGAFLGSTMLRKLRNGEVAEAAAEFPRWNKATVNGVKRELAGLTRRRAAERALFESTAAGGTPTLTGPSDQERVVSAKGYNRRGTNFVVGFGKDDEVVEILKLKDLLPDTLVAVFRLYPNLRSFDFSERKEALPEGERIQFSGLADPIVAVDDAPTLERALLTIGAEDTEHTGNDVREMQSRLKDLGYYAGKLDGVFGKSTDDAVRAFQADYFGRAEADGKVGPITWSKLFGDDTKPPEPPEPDNVEDATPEPGNHYLKLTKTAMKDQFGLFRLMLAYHRDGVFVDSIDVCSGQARKQTFEIGKNSPSGSMEPLPEGKWFVHDIQWADGKDNYSGAIWKDGLGPVKIFLEFLEPGSTPRSAILIHLDWNRNRAPGTAGCIGVHNIADFKKLVGWLRETDPRSLFVDWDLGTCPKP